MKVRTFNRDLFVMLCFWIAERERVRVKKEAGEAKPWTSDTILQQHRFCNARRMDDTVSKWLLDNWYDNKQNARALLIAAALARLINWPFSLAQITGGKKFTIDMWDPRAIRAALHKWEDGKNKVFTGAYIINGAGGGSKIDQVVDNIRNIADCPNKIVYADSMEKTHANLVGFYGIGSFMAGQIVADLRFTSAMKEPTDVMTWAPIGPGSRRGMRRLLGETAAGNLSQKEFDDLLPLLIDQLQKMRRLDFMIEKLEAMDVQNCLCEFDKYVRLKNDEGSVRSKYPGTAESAPLGI